MKRVFPLVLVAAVAFGLVGVFFLTPDLEPGPVAKTPPVAWEPHQLEINLTPQMLTTVASATAHVQTDISATAIEMVPSLAPYVTASPSMLSPLAGGSQVSIELIASVPVGTPFGFIEGTLHLRSGSSTIARPLPVTLAITVVPIPPDPGDAGEQTLEGIDSNGNGLRDDIERYIVVTYPDSARTRMALTQYTLGVQQSLLDTDDRQASRDNFVALSNGNACLFHIQPDAAGAMISELMAEVLNTNERSKAWLAAERHLGGQFLTFQEDVIAACGFDPDILEN